MSIRRLSLCLFVMLALPASTLRAQDLEPRSYSNVPVGLNFVLLGYGHTTGSVALDASSPLQDGEVTTDGVVLAYARSLDLWGDSGKFDLVVPFAWVDGSATFLGEPVSREVDGFGDPLLRLSEVVSLADVRYLLGAALLLECHTCHRPTNSVASTR